MPQTVLIYLERGMALDRMKRINANYLCIALLFFSMVGELWYQAEMYLYGYTQESLVDFAAAIFIAKSLADWFVKEW